MFSFFFHIFKHNDSCYLIKIVWHIAKINFNSDPYLTCSQTNNSRADFLLISLLITTETNRHSSYSRTHKTTKIYGWGNNANCKITYFFFHFSYGQRNRATNMTITKQIEKKILNKNMIIDIHSNHNCVFFFFSSSFYRLRFIWKMIIMVFIKLQSIHSAN